jgi:hypothetical protein
MSAKSAKIESIRDRFSRYMDDVSHLEVGEGWLLIIDSMFDGVKRCLADADLPAEVVRFTQIKEKFGTLRVYWNFDYDLEIPENVRTDIQAIVDHVEDLSACTCETCGVPGELRSGSWIKTLCDGCENGKGWAD